MIIKPPSVIQNLVTQLNNQTSVNGIALPTGTFLGMAIARVAADLSGVTSSTSFIDSGMSFPIKSGETWLGFINYEMGPSLSITGTKFQISCPSGSTGTYSSRATPDALSVSGAYYKNASSIGSSIDYSLLNLTGVGGAGFCQSFTITATNNGTVKFQYAPSGLTITGLILRAGTYFQAYRIA